MIQPSGSVSHRCMTWIFDSNIARVSLSRYGKRLQTERPLIIGRISRLICGVKDASLPEA